MNFKCNTEINKPINEVVKHFVAPEAHKQSQKDFIKMEPLSGKVGEAGATCKLVYKKFDLIETIIYNKLPHEFFANYEHKSMTNTMLTKFTATNEAKTLMDVEIDYLKFRGFIIKLIAKLFPSMFKKQVQKWLVRFRTYCEKQ